MPVAKTLVVDDIEPNAYFPVPLDSDFVDGESGEPTDYLKHDELSRLGNALIDSRTVFIDLNACKIVFLFKKKGGNSKGKLKLGQCQKPSGLLSYFSHTDFVIWAAADNCLGFTWYQMEALLYHELKHASVDYDDQGEKKLTINGHDWEGFADEVRLYGDWKPDIEQIRKAFQPTLFDKLETADPVQEKLNDFEGKINNGTGKKKSATDAWAETCTKCGSSEHVAARCTLSEPVSISKSKKKNQAAKNQASRNAPAKI